MTNKINFNNFPILIKELNIKDYTLISNEVFKYIKSNRDKFKSRWNCNTLSSLKLSPSFEGEFSKKYILEISKLYASEFDFKLPLELDIESLWVNIAPKGGFQEVHNHSNFYTKNLFSGVLYIDVLKDSGDINLINPLNYVFNSFYSTPLIPQEINIPPKNGVMVFFPSFMEHYVNINSSSKERISISWNIGPIQ